MTESRYFSKFPREVIERGTKAAYSMGLVSTYDIDKILTAALEGYELRPIQPAAPAVGENGLLPCPFCGAPAETFEITRGNVDYVSIFCNANRCVQPEAGGLPRDEAIRRWNTRAYTTPGRASTDTEEKGG